MIPTTIKCPDCGARYDGDRDQATCAYCGTRLRFEGEPAPAAPPGAASPGTSFPGARPTSAWAKAAIFVLLGLALLVFLRAVRTVENLGTALPNAPQFAPPSTSAPEILDGPPASTPAKRIRWHGRTPLLALVDSDELLDVIGQTFGEEGELHLIAYSGLDGSELWRSGAVPDVDRSARSYVYLAGDTLVVTGPTGELAAFAVRDGGTRWSLRLAEVARRIAPAPAGSQGEVLLLTEDGRAHGLDLERGALRDAGVEASEVMGYLPASEELAERQRIQIINPLTSQHLSRYAFEGLHLKLACEARDDAFGVALAARTPGTAVPELVRYKSVDEDAHPLQLWRTQVPGVKPLKARIPTGFHGYLDADANHAATVYRIDGKAHEYRAVCCAMEDGRRLWDFKVPGTSPFDSITVRAGRVYVAVWSTLWILDAKSGEVQLQIGDSPKQR